MGRWGRMKDVLVLQGGQQVSTVGGVGPESDDLDKNNTK